MPGGIAGDGPDGAGGGQHGLAGKRQAEDSAVNQSVMAAILCAQDGLTYDPEDPVYFWRAVGYLITLRSMDETFTSSGTDGTHLTAENLPIFVQAMFANYSGEVPSVTEEDPLVSRTEDGGYLIHGPEVSLEMALGGDHSQPGRRLYGSGGAEKSGRKPGRLSGEPGGLYRPRGGEGAVPLQPYRCHKAQLRRK